MRMRILLVTGILITLCFITVLAVYEVEPNKDNYDILLTNRFTKLGYGIDYKQELEIWQFARTVHGGKAERRIYGHGIQ